MARTTKTIYMEEELAEWLEQEAKRENRPLSNFLETLLIRKRETDEKRLAEGADDHVVPLVIG